VNRGRVFVTGGSGFVGRTVLRELSRIDGLDVVAIDRSGSIDAAPRREVIRGNLLEPETYLRALAGCDAVLHLAAATGKASAEVQERDTAMATETLVGACRTAGVERLLFVSSIAAAFPDQRGYPYAAAKVRAERAVAESGLRYCILRPTMIFGEGAPVAASLNTLALLPLVLVPGSGKVRVQPVAVADVARLILFILNNDRFRAETFEVGGPEVLPIEALLQRLRTHRKGKPGAVVRVPLALIQVPLGVAEHIGLGSVLPATAGQFSSFRHDGVARPNPLQQELAPTMASVDSMIAAIRPTVAGVDPVAEECVTFTRHLLGLEPDPVVIRSYGAALAALPALNADSPWDRALLSLARRGVGGTRAADAFAALFARASVLRQRLVILLAILETRPPFSDRIDEALGGSRWWVFARIAWKGLGSVAYLVAGAVWLVPARLIQGARGVPPR
jgi:NADH dehydrogenase